MLNCPHGKSVFNFHKVSMHPGDIHYVDICREQNLSFSQVKISLHLTCTFRTPVLRYDSSGQWHSCRNRVHWIKRHKRPKAHEIWRRKRRQMPLCSTEVISPMKVV